MLLATLLHVVLFGPILSLYILSLRSHFAGTVTLITFTPALGAVVHWIASCDIPCPRCALTLTCTSLVETVLGPNANCIATIWWLFVCFVWLPAVLTAAWVPVVVLTFLLGGEMTLGDSGDSVPLVLLVAGLGVAISVISVY